MTVLTYEPITTTTAANHAQVRKPNAGRNKVECPTCIKLYLPAAIVTSSPWWSDEHQCLQVLRRCYCDHCNRIISWFESANGAGQPTGLLLSGPGSSGGAEYIAKFLANHPEAIGADHV